MILGIISTIFAGLGIYGFFSGNLFWLEIGMICVIIEHIIGIVKKEQKSLNTVWIALLVSFGLMAGGVNPFEAIAICLCFEGVICFVLGLVIMILFYNMQKNNNKN